MNKNLLIAMMALQAAPAFAAVVTPRATPPVRYAPLPGSQVLVSAMLTNSPFLSGLGLSAGDVPVFANAMVRSGMTLNTIAVADLPAIRKEMLGRAHSYAHATAQLSGQVGRRNPMVEDIIPSMREFVEAARLVNPAEKTADLVRLSAEVERLGLQQDIERAQSKARELAERLLADRAREAQAASAPSVAAVEQRAGEQSRAQSYVLGVAQLIRQHGAGNGFAVDSMPSLSRAMSEARANGQSSDALESYAAELRELMAMPDSPEVRLRAGIIEDIIMGRASYARLARGLTRGGR